MLALMVFIQPTGQCLVGQAQYPEPAGRAVGVMPQQQVDTPMLVGTEGIKETVTATPLQQLFEVQRVVGGRMAVSDDAALGIQPGQAAQRREYAAQRVQQL